MTDISYDEIAKKKSLIRYSLLAIVVVLCSIFGLWSNQAPQSNQNKSNTLTISGPWEISSLEPSQQGYILTRMQVLETLVNVSSAGELTPGLALNWQASDDGLSWLFTLRNNVEFHDGTLVNAAAVVASLGHAQQKHGVLNKADIAKITAIGNNQIRITLSQPYISLAALLTNYSTAILAPASYNESGDINVLYGTGAYQISSFSPPHKLTVKQFSGYWAQQAKIPYATYLTGHRAESRLLQAKTGDADIVFTLDPAMLSQLTSNQTVKVHSNLIPRTLFLKLNNSHPLLSDIRTRQALDLALDRHSIATNVLHAQGSETSQILPRSFSQWYLPGITASKLNLTKAQALLSEQGWLKNESGLLRRDGQPFKLTLMTYADRPELTVVATAIQAQWAKLGIDLKINVTNSSMIPAGHQDGTLELALIARNFGSIADPFPIISTDFSHGGGDWGTMNWHNAQVDNAINQLSREHDMAKRFTLSQTIAKVIHQQLPVLPITSYTQHTSVNQRVKNFKFDPYERNYFINQMVFK
ncbi:MAG: ABC transporter substrate-binding protein [Gammaproteobacteria bacterium]|nr:ABC transporter substrate-binding protein [Gammaproteobacteria bacterium]